MMMLSNRKYSDPTAVLQSLVDDFGNQIMVGEQKDIGEFNLNFLERVEEGLGELNKSESDDSQGIEEDGDGEIIGNRFTSVKHEPISRHSSILGDAEGSIR